MTTLPAAGLRSYDLYEIACLAGGLRRVVDTAVVALVESGVVKVRLTGELYAEGLRRGHPVERGPRRLGARGRSIETLRRRALEDERVRAVADRLERDHAAVARLLADVDPGLGEALIRELNRRQFERAVARTERPDPG